MVGKAIYKALKTKGYKNILTASKEELNLLNQSKVINWFEENKPDIVILAAARVGGIYANDIYPVNFLLENLKFSKELKL